MSKTRFFPLAALAVGLCALALPASADPRGQAPHPPGETQMQGPGHPAQGGLVLFTDAGFRGRSVEVQGAVPRLNSLRFNDRASSLMIRSGVWEVCTDANFRGRCEIIDGDVPRLKAYRLNDNISSVRPAMRGSSYPDQHRDEPRDEHRDEPRDRDMHEPR